MANSRQHGAFGLLRKSIGSLVYSKSKDGSGKTIQVVRSKPTSVTNPNTVNQILQRAKIKPASRFYAAMVGILDHSWQGVEYGNASRSYFMSKALSQVGPYIPKSVTEMIPAEYPVSEGSMAKLTASPVSLEGASIAGSALTQANVDALIDAGLPAGAQLTVIAFYRTTSGAYDFAYGRIINEAGQMFAWTKSTAANMTVEVVNGVIAIPVANGAATVAVAAIASQYKNGVWERSTQSLVLTDAFRDGLYDNQALELTVASYQGAVDLNKINSAWYLNLASGQPFPGQLYIADTYLSDEAETKVPIPFGRQVAADGSLLRNVVFTDDGTATGKLIKLVNDSFVQGTAEETTYVTRDPGSKYYGYTTEMWLDVYATQLGF